ncbi:MAG: DUF5710 domain-containing protein [Methylococcales bacterium]|nr:DUF5710 domain-containing protein [Methylococcales bacterium]
MLNSKTYLNVPYAQKDAAKALGARWDPTQKKWYVPANVDVFLFDAWRIESASDQVDTQNLTTILQDTLLVSAGKKSQSGAVTFPTDKNFVAYDGDLPPWE